MDSRLGASASEWATALPRLSVEVEQEKPWQVTSSRAYLFGVPIDRISLSEAVALLEGWIQDRGKRVTHLVFTVDTPALMRARWDEHLKGAYLSADLVTADGIGLVWASWILGVSLPERVAGIDLLGAFFPCAAREGYRIFLLGAKPGVAQLAAHKLQERFPTLKIVGTHHGYFNDEEDGVVLREIRRARPDVLLVGLGVPRQEQWMLHHKAHLEVPVVMGVGGSFDVLSGLIPRAPTSWQKLGLEWLWRSLLEPKRFWHVRVIPLFLLKVLLHRALQVFS